MVNNFNLLWLIPIFFVGLILIYLTVRIVTVAFFKSFFETKFEYLTKLIGGSNESKPVKK